MKNDIILRVAKPSRYPKICSYIDNELFDHIHLLHEDLVPDEGFNEDFRQKIKGTTIFVNLDTNLFKHYYDVLKKGRFTGSSRKDLVAFLVWAMREECYFSPYDALSERAYFQTDSIKSNMECSMFGSLFSNDVVLPIIDSFFDEDVVFKDKIRYEEKSEEVDFRNYSSEFKLLYASMLHYVYVLRTEKRRDVVVKYLDWYMDNVPNPSMVLLTYVLMLDTQTADVAPPHHYMDDEMAIKGCVNEAMDLYFLNQLNKARYDPQKYTILFATEEKALPIIFWKSLLLGRDMKSFVDEIYGDEVKRDLVWSYMIQILFRPKQGVSADDLVNIEETTLKKLLK